MTKKNTTHISHGMISDFKLLSWADLPDNISNSSQSSESQLDPIDQLTFAATVAQKILETLAKVQNGRSGIASRSEKNFKKRRNRRRKNTDLLSPMTLGAKGAADGIIEAQSDLFGSSEVGKTEQLPTSPNAPTCFLAGKSCSDVVVE